MKALVRQSRGALCVILAGTVLQGGLATTQAQRLKDRPGTRTASTTGTDAVKAVAAAYRTALAQPAVQNAVRTELIRQVQTKRPVAVVNGYWVTPIDLSKVYGIGTVRSAMLATLGGNGVSLIGAATADPGARLGFAFTQAELGRLLMGDMAKDLAASFAPGALQAKMTGMAIPVAIAVGGGLGLVPWVGFYVGTSTPVGDWLVDLFFGSDESENRWNPDNYDPDADPDGDGKPNYIDDDDDGDGVPDEEDLYPDDSTKSICDCGRPAVFFTSRMSDQITGLILSASNVLTARGNTVVPLGAVGSGLPGAVGVVIPAGAP